MMSVPDEGYSTNTWCALNSISIKKSLKIPQGGNQNAYIEEEQTTQWSKEKVTRTPLKSEGELRCS